MDGYKSLVRVQNKDQENQGMFGSGETAWKQDMPPENKQGCRLQFNYFQMSALGQKGATRFQTGRRHQEGNGREELETQYHPNKI